LLAAIEQLESAPLIRAGVPQVEPFAVKLRSLKDSLQAPLRVAILGEIKAGKSTLINAIVGATPAATGILEATSWITVIRSGQDRGLIERNDGTTETMAAAELATLLVDKRGDEEFASSIDRVVFELEAGGIEGLELLDTPGLGGTDALGDHTRRHLAEYDIVLWVFNALKQGSKPVLDAFAEVGRLGKPMVAVVNQLDEVDVEDREQLLEAFEDDTDTYADSIFGLSAARALEGKEDGVADLRQRLLSYAARPDEAKLESVQRQLSFTGRGLADLHDAVRETILLERGKHESLEKQIGGAATRVIAEVCEGADRWLQQDLLASQEAKLLKAAKKSKEACLAAYEAEDRDATLTIELARFVEFVSEQWKRAWLLEGQKIEQSWKPADNTVVSRIEDRLESASEMLRLIAPDSVSAQLMVGGVMGAAAGTAIGTQVALLGPAAAWVPLGAALGAWIPPVALAGVAVGGVKIVWDRRKERSERVQGVRLWAQQGRRVFADEVWRTQLKPIVIEKTDEQKESILNAARQRQLPGPSLDLEEMSCFAAAARVIGFGA
jgi:hypothetical protein